MLQIILNLKVFTVVHEALLMRMFSDNLTYCLPCVRLSGDNSKIQEMSVLRQSMKHLVPLFGRCMTSSAP